MGLMKKIEQWLTLLRFPNFFTLPGDVIVGYIIAEATLNKSSNLLGYSFNYGGFISYSVFYLIIAICASYAVGLITNDIADYDEDSRVRPERPIPSGAISRKSAYCMALFFSVIAVLFAKLVSDRVFNLVFILLILIYLYNFLLKKNPFTGASTMALLRSFAVMVGFFGAWYVPDFYPPMLYVVILTWFLYFSGVSLIAYYETDENPPVRGRYILIFIPVLWGCTAIFASECLAVIFLLKEIPPGILFAIITVVIFAVLSLKNFIHLNKRPRVPSKIQKSVGEQIRLIIFLQSSAAAFMGYPFVAVFLLFLYIPAMLAARKFYSS